MRLESFARDQEQQLKEIRKYSTKEAIKEGKQYDKDWNIQFNESRRWRNNFIEK